LAATCTRTRYAHCIRAVGVVAHRGLLNDANGLLEARLASAVGVTLVQPCNLHLSCAVDAANGIGDVVKGRLDHRRVGKCHGSLACRLALTRQHVLPLWTLWDEATELLDLFVDRCLALLL